MYVCMHDQITDTLLNRWESILFYGKWVIVSVHKFNYSWRVHWDCILWELDKKTKLAKQGDWEELVYLPLYYKNPREVSVLLVAAVGRRH